MIARFDDWTGAHSSLGGVRDKHRGTYFGRRCRLRREQLDTLYEQNETFARMVDKIADDALREGWELEDVITSDGSKPEDHLDRVYAECDDLSVNPTLAQSTKWSRLYGGALAVLPIYDRRPPDTPAALDRAIDIYPLKVVPAEDARPNHTDGDFASPTYLRTLDYDISGLATSTVRVHHSRVIPFEAISLPPRALYTYSPNGWGPSIAERVYDELARDGAAASHAVSMMYISSILWIAMEGFREELVGDPARLQRGLALTRQQLDAHGLLGLDAKDKIGNLSLAVTGAHELLDRLRARLASVANMPKEILFNESPAGLNAGELSGPQEIWFGTVAAFQAGTLTPALDRILRAVFAVRRIPIVSWRVKWRPLWTRSDSSAAEINAKNAAADTAYVTMGALDPHEVRAHRFERGGLGPIEVQPETPAQPLDLSGEDVGAYEAAATGGAPQARDVTPALAIIEKVASGAIPRDAGEALLAAAGFSPALLGSAGIDVEGGAGPAEAAAPADLLSARDAAAQYGVPTVAITGRMRDGTLPYWGIGAHKRVSAADVAKLAKAHEEPADDAAE